LSSAYGAGVDPSRPSTVSTLYPLSALTLQALTGQSTSGIFNPDGSFVPGFAENGISGTSGPAVSPAAQRAVLGNFGCDGSNGLTKGQARVVAVQPGRIVARDVSGKQIVLTVSSCSKLNAVQENVSLVPQSTIYFKGVQTVPGALNLQQLTCV